MAEIRSPNKQSYINKPIGVARTNTGIAENAQAIARTTQAYSNSVMSASNQIMSAAINVQQNYELKKYTDWASTVKIQNEAGEIEYVNLPSSVSMKTETQVNNILNKRYDIANQEAFRRQLLDIRANTNDPESFLKLASERAAATADAMRKSGASNEIVSNFEASSSILSGDHFRALKIKSIERSENEAFIAYQNSHNTQLANVIAAYKSGDPNAANLEQILYSKFIPSADPENLGQIDAIQIGNYTASGAQEEYSKARRAIAEAKLFSSISGYDSTTQKQIVLAIDTGNITDKVRGLVPNIDDVMSGILTPQDRNAFVAGLTTTANKLADIENDITTQQNLLSAAGGTGKKSQQLTDRVLANAGIGVDVVSISNNANSQELQDLLSGVSAFPTSMVTVIDNIANGNIDIETIGPQVINNISALAYQSIIAPDGSIKGKGKGLSDDSIAWLLAFKGNQIAMGNEGALLSLSKTLRTSETNMDWRQVVGDKVDNDNWETTRPSTMMEKYLNSEGLYSPSFNKLMGNVGARLLQNHSLSSTEDILDKIYDMYYQSYDYAWQPENAKQRQFLMPNAFYADDIELAKFEGHLTDVIKSQGSFLIDGAPVGTNYLTMGENLFLRSDSRNSLNSARWYLVDYKNNNVLNQNGQPVIITSEAVKAQSILQRRNFEINQLAQRMNITEAEARKIKRDTELADEAVGSIVTSPTGVGMF